MTEYRIVGWLNSNEWNQVYRELFSKSISRRKHALQRIAVWKSRLINKLSASIECTAVLVEAVLTDEESMKNNQIQFDDTKICMNYSMALIRFINAMTETCQNKEYAQAVHKIAELMGLPEWLVELRHQASHSSLPSLEILRNGAKFALQWLRSEYWESHKDSTKQTSELSSNQREELYYQLEDAFVTFMQEQYMVSDFQSKSLTLNSTERQRVRTSLEEMEHLMSIDSDLAIKVMMQDGYLIPTEEQLTSLGVDVKMFVSSAEPTLPPCTRKIWIPAFRVLDKLEKIQDLFLELLKSVQISSGLRHQLIHAWIYDILNALNRKKGKSTVLPISQSLDYSLLVDYIGLDKDENPLYQRILEVSGLSVNQKQLITKLTDMYSSTSDHKVTGKTAQRIYTVDDLQDFISPETPDDKIISDSTTTDKTSTVKSPVSSRWQYCSDDVNWSRYPIGSAPDVSITYKNMELWNDDNSQSLSDEENCDNMDSVESESNEQFNPTLDNELPVFQLCKQFSKEQIDNIVENICLM